MSIILELIEIISDSALIKKWLHLLNAKQNDIQNRDKRKQEILSVHKKPAVSIKNTTYTVYENYIYSLL